MTPTDLEWAYIARLVDGEGCITSYRNSKANRNESYYTRVHVSQRKPEVLYWLIEVLGKGRVQQRKGKTRPYHVWASSNASSLPILRGTLPYLRIKKEEAELAIELATLPRPNVDRQREIHLLLKELKQL